MTLKFPILKSVNRAHSPSTACTLQSTAPLVYRYYRTTTHLVSRQIYFHPGEQNRGKEAKGHVLGQEPASCRPCWTSWCCLFAHCLHAIQVNPFPTHKCLTAEHLGGKRSFCKQLCAYFPMLAAPLGQRTRIV